MSIHQTLFAGYANPLRVVDGADFDGTDMMLRGADLTGISDGKMGIISIWARLDGGDGSLLTLLDNSVLSGSSGFRVVRENDNTFRVQARTFLNSLILGLYTSGTYTAGASWHHILASWDMATVGARHLYISDTADLAAPVFADNTIDYTRGEFGVGTDNASVTYNFNGALADVYFAPGQYLDFSNVYNRRKFISASGKPVHLGTDGSLPTGTAPLLYLHLDDGEAVANFATNRGTGGNFTITGTLATASDSPSD